MAEVIEHGKYEFEVVEVWLGKKVSRGSFVRKEQAEWLAHNLNGCSGVAR